eukprot:TRINITY_DN7847_c0_g1_i2.p1 TRINITY_DN7847_c0_g1~~TRINITY_DN7847_c0_g1_i2.p1  ORF type:complete len:219 (-),score=28.86 TRINITY_DN7847_c0_g1_i2:45-701(-)
MCIRDSSKGIEQSSTSKEWMVIFLYQRAKAFLKNKSELDALSDLRRAVEIDRDDFKVQKLKAEVHLSRREVKAALLHFSCAKKLSNRHDLTYLEAKIMQTQKQIQDLRNVDYYDLLGISRDFTLQELKRRRNILLQAYHPDKAHPEVIEDSVRITQTIIHAYEKLKALKNNDQSRETLKRECEVSSPSFYSKSSTNNERGRLQSAFFGERNVWSKKYK